MIKPRAHQLEAMNFHKTNPYIGTLLWHGMGLGKTLTTLWLARDHMAKMRAQGVPAPKFMIILPKSAVPTWRVECHKHTPELVRDMIIYPYSQLSKAFKMLSYVDIRMIAFDESHYLKSPETDRVKTLCDFLNKLGTTGGMFKGGRILMLTGTPMPNSASELYTTWALCSTSGLTESANRLSDNSRFDKWKRTFAQAKEKTWKTRYGQERGTSYEGVANSDKLQQLISPITHYRRVSDCIDLPNKEEIYIDLGLEDDRLLKDADIEKPEAYMAVLERLSRAKTPYLMDWVKDYLATGNQQLLVFSNYVEPLRELKEKYSKDVVLITGDETGTERAMNLKAFQDGNIRVIAMSYKCGSESLNLQNAFVSLYHGYPWTDSAVKQAMARTHRQGQSKRTLHYFLTSGQNDSRILSLVRKKEEATTEVEDLLLVASVVSLDSFI
jgi:SNF2 family DNA or RNA helicase